MAGVAAPGRRPRELVLRVTHPLLLLLLPVKTAAPGPEAGLHQGFSTSASASLPSPVPAAASWCHRNVLMLSLSKHHYFLRFGVA